MTKNLAKDVQRWGFAGCHGVFSVLFMFSAVVPYYYFHLSLCRCELKMRGALSNARGSAVRPGGGEKE